jgi:hypothetical protein
MARSEDSTLVNTHIIYKDEQGRIREMWTDGRTPTWQNDEPSVFADVDDDTDLACLTITVDPPSFEQDYYYPAYLVPNTHLQRCFFQRRGFIVEVRRTEDGWEEIGEIPMP